MKRSSRRGGEGGKGKGKGKEKGKGKGKEKGKGKGKGKGKEELFNHYKFSLIVTIISGNTTHHR